jgi:hypothetical protein
MPKGKKETKTTRPYTKGNKLQTRANNEQLQTLVTKASVYFKGNMSELLLQAALAYRPVKKGEGVKA